MFERHLPEKVRLPGLPVRRGTTVEVRADQQSHTWGVANVVGGEAHLRRRVDDGNTVTDVRPVAELVVVRECGQAIYPGLRSVGRIERGGDKPFHTVINAENYHALEMLLYTCERQVDAIYIDPPYNTGARDWKYNNDYVDGNDGFRHSKWLSFIEKRLELAKRLLRPEHSVLILTIDEKEYLRLGLLLEQVFPQARIQMVSVQINPALVARRGAFGRNDEYVFFVMVGDASPQRVRLGDDWVSAKGRTFKGTVRWDLLRRSGTNAKREDRRKLFYPILVNPTSRRVVGTGEWLPEEQDPPDAQAPENLVCVWPIRRDGSQGNWQLRQTALMEHVEQGRVRLGGSPEKGYVVYYIKGGEYEKIKRGDYPVLGRKTDGSLDLGGSEEPGNLVVPGTQWRIASHDATQYGSRLLAKLLPGRQFPFPKSLYAVEDALRFFVADKPDALVVDFFGGSGTTTHAVMRLNRADGGGRRSILVTNNEIGPEAEKELASQGLCAGDAGWERLGIFEQVAKPRIEAATTGVTHEGQAIAGDYKFVDEFPMAEGFEENVEFFKLTYEDPDRVQLGIAFEAVAAQLWLMAGAIGPRIDQISGAWTIPDGGRYGVLFDADAWPDFTRAVKTAEGLSHAFIVTDSDAVFQRVVADLPDTATPVRLYESYLRSFAINTGARA